MKGHYAEMHDLNFGECQAYFIKAAHSKFDNAKQLEQFLACLAFCRPLHQLR